MCVKRNSDVQVMLAFFLRWTKYAFFVRQFTQTYFISVIYIYSIVNKSSHLFDTSTSGSFQHFHSFNSVTNNLRYCVMVNQNMSIRENTAPKYNESRDDDMWSSQNEDNEVLSLFSHEKRSNNKNLLAGTLEYFFYDHNLYFLQSTINSQQFSTAIVFFVYDFFQLLFILCPKLYKE